MIFIILTYIIFINTYHENMVNNIYLVMLMTQPHELSRET